MKFYLPTLEEVETICENTDAFFIKDTVVEGQNVKLVDYRLASISDFANNNAFECRGLCFVQQDNGTWERNLLLNKFFNLSQCSQDDLYEIVLDNGETLQVNETHKFQVKSNANKINDKFARDLAENDNIIGWDAITQ